MHFGVARCPFFDSHGADVHLAEAELTLKKRKARRDAVAAQIILQSYLDARKREA